MQKQQADFDAQGMLGKTPGQPMELAVEPLLLRGGNGQVSTFPGFAKLHLHQDNGFSSYEREVYLGQIPGFSLDGPVSVQEVVDQRHFFRQTPLPMRMELLGKALKRG